MTQLNIFIVDDSAFVRIGLRNYLEKKGFVVCEASGMIQAIRIFEETKPDIAILDISLQIGPNGIEGLSLAQKLKEKDSKLGIILLSGSASHYQEFLDLSKKYSGIAYLYKGDNYKDELMSAINLVRKGGIWVAPEIANYKNTSEQISLSNFERIKIDCVLPLFTTLTEKEREIVQLLAASNDNEAIAEKLCISLNTVSSHLSKIYSKVGLGENMGRSEKRLLLAKASLLNQIKNN